MMTFYWFLAGLAFLLFALWCDSDKVRYDTHKRKSVLSYKNAETLSDISHLGYRLCFVIVVINMALQTFGV